MNARGGTLANSNQRTWKGFAYTFSLPRDYKGFVGRYKLDWFFVKPAPAPLTEASSRSRVFRPQFARTMQALNQGLAQRLSDDAPITIDLPLADSPAIHRKRTGAK